jgi:hypothetical protein
VETVEVSSTNDSISLKELYVYCPAGKRVIGTGARTPGGWAGWPIAVAEVTTVGMDVVHVVAFETAATSNNWQIAGQAICANVD